jgi:hypothetical protein
MAIPQTKKGITQKKTDEEHLHKRTTSKNTNRNSIYKRMKKEKNI